jgi:hypothetical protein
VSRTRPRASCVFCSAVSLPQSACQVSEIGKMILQHLLITAMIDIHLHPSWLLDPI